MMSHKLIELLREELFGLNGRWLLARLLLAPFPNFVGSRLRAKVLRALGFQVGTGVAFFGLPIIISSGQSHKKLTIGNHSLFNVQCFLDLAGPITIGENVTVGPQVMLITGAHQIAGSNYRLGAMTPQAIEIHRGAWLGARCTILPGVTIGAGAVIAAGALVTKDVAPNTLVGGVPARLMRVLDEAPTR